MSSRRRAWEGIYVTVQPLALNLISVPVTFYIVARQGDTNYGHWTTATAITGALVVLGSLGMRPIFVRTLAQDLSAAPVRLGEQFTLRVMLSLLASAIAIGTCLLLRHDPIVLACVAIGSAGLVLSAMSDALIDTLHAFESFTSQTNAFFLSGLSQQAAAMLVCWWGLGPVSLALSYLVGPALNVLAMSVLVHKRHFSFRPQWNPTAFRQILRESRLLGRQSILQSIHDRLESLVLPKFVPTEAFGQFSAGLTPATRLNVVPSGVTTVFFPRIAKAGKDGAPGAEPLVEKLFLALLCTALPATLGVIFFGPWISRVLFPDDPALSNRVIVTTIWSLPLVAIAWAMAAALQACGHHNRQARAGIASSVVSLGLGTALVVSFGLVGALISWLMRPFVTCLLLLSSFRHVFPGLLRRLPWGRLALAGGAMQCALTAGGETLGRGLGALCLVGMLASLVFYAVLIVLRAIPISALGSFFRGRSDPPVVAADRVGGTPS